jgi:hypothetical protein
MNRVKRLKMDVLISITDTQRGVTIDDKSGDSRVIRYGERIGVTTRCHRTNVDEKLKRPGLR